MSNMDKKLFRTENYAPTFDMYTPAADQVFAKGDPVFVTSGTIKPASQIGAIPGVHADLAAAQEAFHDAFLGVADEASAQGSVTPIRIQTGGRRVMPCVDTNYTIGQLVGPNDNAGGTALVSELIGVATPNLAIGRVIQPGTSVDSIEVNIQSTLLSGGPRAIA